MSNSSLSFRLWQAGNAAGARDTRRGVETPHNTSVTLLCDFALNARSELCPGTPLPRFAEEAATIFSSRGICVAADDILAASIGYVPPEVLEAQTLDGIRRAKEARLAA